MKISIAQYSIEFGKPHRNLDLIRQFAQSARNVGSDLLILPELCLHGYHKQSIIDNSQYHLPNILPILSEVAIENKLGIIGTFVEAVGDTRFNTLIHLTEDGNLLSSYRKTHLFKPMNEHLFFSAGDQFEVSISQAGKVGYAICYDIRFPELFRRMALKGAEIFFIPAEWPAERIDHWIALLKARAIENLAFVVGCNCIGLIYKTNFGGNSIVVTPWGEVIFQTDQDGIHTIDIDLKEVRAIRKDKPFLEDMEII